MQKGSSVEANSDFIRNAHAAGLSIRCTIFKGFPGETAEDMQATARFLEAHAPYLDRVRFNQFSLQHDTPIFKAVVGQGARAEGLVVGGIQDRRARALYRDARAASPAYRKAKARTLAAVFDINRRPLRDAARQFDGLM